jgi:hypothetical protein
MIGVIYERVMTEKAMQAIYLKAKITYVKPDAVKEEAEKTGEGEAGKFAKKAAAKGGNKASVKPECVEPDMPETIEVSSEKANK